MDEPLEGLRQEGYVAQLLVERSIAYEVRTRKAKAFRNIKPGPACGTVPRKLVLIPTQVSP